MRYKSAEVKEKILQYINAFYGDNGRTPGLREISGEVDRAKPTVMSYLQEMSEEGMLEYSNGKIMTSFIRSILAIPNEYLKKAPISCGPMELALQQTEDYVEIPKSMLGKGTYFALTASGDSMHNAGIDDGDLIIVRQAKEATYGQIIVALDEQGQNTLKRYMFDEKKQRPYLHPENSKYPDMYPNEIIVQGIAEKVIKELV